MEKTVIAKRHIQVIPLAVLGTFSLALLLMVLATQDWISLIPTLVCLIPFVVCALINFRTPEVLVSLIGSNTIIVLHQKKMEILVADIKSIQGIRATYAAMSLPSSGVASDGSVVAAGHGSMRFVLKSGKVIRQRRIANVQYATQNLKTILEKSFGN